VGANSGNIVPKLSNWQAFAYHPHKASPLTLKRSHPSAHKSCMSTDDSGVTSAHFHRPNATPFVPLRAATQRASGSCPDANAVRRHTQTSFRLAASGADLFAELVGTGLLVRNFGLVNKSSHFSIHPPPDVSRPATLLVEDVSAPIPGSPDLISAIAALPLRRKLPSEKLIAAGFESLLLLPHQHGCCQVVP